MDRQAPPELHARRHCGGGVPARPSPHRRAVPPLTPGSTRGRSGLRYLLLALAGVGRVTSPGAFRGGQNAHGKVPACEWIGGREFNLQASRSFARVHNSHGVMRGIIEPRCFPAPEHRSRSATWPPSRNPAPRAISTRWSASSSTTSTRSPPRAPRSSGSCTTWRPHTNLGCPTPTGFATRSKQEHNPNSGRERGLPGGQRHSARRTGPDRTSATAGGTGPIDVR